METQRWLIYHFEIGNWRVARVASKLLFIIELSKKFFYKKKLMATLLETQFIT